jgi:hypothetical protein
MARLRASWGVALRCGARLLQALGPGVGVLTTIQDRVDPDDFTLHPVVDGEREPPGEEAVKALVVERVDAGEQRQRFDVRREGIEEVVAQAGFCCS